MSKPLKLHFDEVIIENPFGDAELIIKNSTKDTVGFLYNIGGGVTEFRAIPDMTSLDQDLIDIAALSAANDDIIQRKGGVWTNRTIAQYKADLVLTKSDVGLALADNTADLDKPISTLTQTALNLKSSLASPAFTGTPTAPTAAPGTNTTQLATTAFVTAAVSAATTGVASFKGRTGTVVPATNDYTWAQIDKTTSSFADLATRSATDISSGTLADARLSSNVVLLAGTQTLTNKTINGSNNTLSNIGLGSLAQGGATTGQVIKWNGSAWAPAADAIGGGITDGDYGDIVVTSTGALISIKALAVSTAKIAALAVTDAKINDVAWSKITGKPTTISGYGITDGVTLTGSQTLTNKTLVTPVIANGSDAEGDTYYRNASGLFTRLAIGSTGQVLKVVGGIPAWAADATGGGAGGTLADGDYGDVTVSGTGTSIMVDAGAISNSKLSSVSTNTIKGRITASSGAPEDLTVTQVTSMLNVFSSSLKGLAPASGGGSVNFLRADGSWATPIGAVYSFSGGLTETGGTATIASGGVTTVKIADANVTDAKIVTVAWSKVTTTPTTVSGYGITDAVTLTGTQTLTNKTLTSPKINVGSDATGDIYYRDASGNLVRLAIGSNGQVLKIASGLPAWGTDSTGGGVVSDGSFGDITISGSGSVYTIAANAVTTAKILDANVTDAKIVTVAWSKITSTPTSVSGYGITDAATLTGTQTLTNKTLTSPKINVGSDATGDIHYRDASGNFVRLAIGSNGQVLKIASGLPAWGTDNTGGGGVSDGTYADIAISASGSVYTVTNNAITTAKILDANVTNAKLATGIDAAKLADGSVSNAELQFINSLTSNAQTQISARALIASPTFTGIPAAPTAATGTDTTQLATTAFVQQELNARLAEPGPVALTDGSTITWDWEDSAVAYVTIAGNRTLSVSNVPDGQSGIIVVTQDATGGRSLTLTGHVEGELNTDASAETVIGFVKRGSTLYWSIDNQDASGGGTADYAPEDLEFIVASGQDGDSSFDAPGTSSWKGRLFRNGILQPKVNSTGRGTYTKAGETITLSGSTLVEGELIQVVFYKTTSAESDVDAQAYFARVIAAGGTLTETEMSAYTEFVSNAKGAGYYSKLKAFYPYLGSSDTVRRLNTISSSYGQTWTSVTFTSGSGGGVSGNGSTSFINTNFNPQSVFATETMFYGSAIVENTAADVIEMGAYETLTAIANLFPYSTGNLSNGVIGSNGLGVSVSGTGASGIWGVSRTSSTSLKLYRNGSTLGSSTSNDTGLLPNLNFYILGRNSSGNVLQAPSPKTHKADYIGDALSDAEWLAFYSHLSSLLSAIGR